MMLRIIKSKERGEKHSRPNISSVSGIWKINPAGNLVRYIQARNKITGEQKHK